MPSNWVPGGKDLSRISTFNNDNSNYRSRNAAQELISLLSCTSLNNTAQELIPLLSCTSLNNSIDTRGACDKRTTVDICTWKKESF